MSWQSAFYLRFGPAPVSRRHFTGCKIRFSAPIEMSTRYTNCSLTVINRAWYVYLSVGISIFLTWSNTPDFTLVGFHAIKLASSPLEVFVVKGEQKTHGNLFYVLHSESHLYVSRIRAHRPQICLLKEWLKYFRLHKEYSLGDRISSKCSIRMMSYHIGSHLPPRFQKEYDLNLPSMMGLSHLFP